MIEYHNKKSSGSFWEWLFYWYCGVTKDGQREWALRMCGITVFNALEV